MMREGDQLGSSTKSADGKQNDLTLISKGSNLCPCPNRVLPLSEVLSMHWDRPDTIDNDTGSGVCVTLISLLFWPVCSGVKDKDL